MPDAEPPSTIPALLARHVAERGDQEAVVTARESLTYQDLDRRTGAMASALLAAGAGKGARIGLLAPDGMLFVTAFLGALRIGALVTTVSTLCTPPELAHILRHSDCQLVLAARRYLSHDYAATLAAAFPALRDAAPGGLRLADAPYLRAIWLDDADGIGWAAPIDELLAQADDDTLLPAIEREVAPSDAAVVVYTSGSTAQPKAVVHQQWALARHSPELARNFVLRPGDRMMVLLPHFWLAGMSTMLQVLSVGGTLIYPETPDLEAVLDTIERFDVNRVNAWGDRQPRLVEAALARGFDIARIPEFGGFRDAKGEPVPPKISMYGMTESFSAHSAEPLDRRLPEDKAASYGRAINGYERRVVDPETGAEMPPGQVGELQIRGPALMAGFYKVERRKVFTPDGFYPTRDLVTIDAEGYLYPAGRLDDMIKTRGANVSRLEVEAALAALPEVEVAVVAGLPDAEFGKLVAAAVVAASGARPTEEELKAALRGTLSSYKVPRRIVFIAEADIPRTATGKVKLSETAAMIAERL
jgi:acyl-CoA synthetase (AMP-forming)/AMP-acid ligase II